MSPSKTFNLPGLNFAFAIVADAALRRRLLRPGAGLLPFPGCFAVAAAEAAYRDGGDWHTGLLDYLRGNRDALEAFVAAELPRVRMTHVEATYLAWLDVRALGLEDPAAACRSAGVALSAGAAFGDPAYLRLNFGCRRRDAGRGAAPPHRRPQVTPPRRTDVRPAGVREARPPGRLLHSAVVSSPSSRVKPPGRRVRRADKAHVYRRRRLLALVAAIVLVAALAAVVWAAVDGCGSNGHRSRPRLLRSFGLRVRRQGRQRRRSVTEPDRLDGSALLVAQAQAP